MYYKLEIILPLIGVAGTIIIYLINAVIGQFDERTQIRIRSFARTVVAWAEQEKKNMGWDNERTFIEAKNLLNKYLDKYNIKLEEFEKNGIIEEAVNTLNNIKERTTYEVH